MRSQFSFTRMLLGFWKKMGCRGNKHDRETYEVTMDYTGGVDVFKASLNTELT